MVLRIFKKNTSTSTKDYQISEGSTITENYNETLDSANVRLSHLTSALSIEPLDKVALIDTEGRLTTRYMVIDTFVETMESLDPIIYSYEISLVSETKELEGIMCPNLSITKNELKPKTVWYYLRNYLDMYGTKVKKGTIESYSYDDKYDFNAKVELKFYNIICPELQWNQPTLREVLTDLMMVADCIPVMRNNEIDYIDLTEKKSDISKNRHINYIQRSQSLEDYVSELKVDMQNVQQTSLENVKTTVDTIEWITFKSDSAILTTENRYLKTKFPILNVKHLYMCFQCGVGNDSSVTPESRFFKGDLMDLDGVNYLYEKTEYDVLPIRGPWNLSPSSTGIWQNNTLFFTRGDNKILGWETGQKNDPEANGISINWCKFYMERIANGKRDINNRLWTNVAVSEMPEYEWYSVFFQIEYETQANAVFQAGKGIAPTHQRVVIDNQTNSYIDAYNQGFLEYQKANRLGNKQLHINARYEDDWSNLIKIGDFYEDSIVFQTQYQIYKNHIEVNASATKDYILRNYFTGVKARVRSWVIASGEEALTRHELIKYYFEFSKREKKDVLADASPSPNYFLTNYIIRPINNGYTLLPLKYSFCQITTTNENDDEVTYPYSSRYNNAYCYEELLGRVFGNSLVFTFGMMDNFSMGKALSDSDITYIVGNSAWSYTFGSLPLNGRTFQIIDSDHNTNPKGGIVFSNIRYVNYNGECDKIHFVLRSNIGQSADITENASWDWTEEQNFMYDQAYCPIVDASRFPTDSLIEDDLIVHKDDREILQFSVQFEFCSDTHDIVFTKRFIESNILVRNSNDDLDTIVGFKVYYSSLNNFEPNNPNLSHALRIEDADLIFGWSQTYESVRIRIIGIPDNIDIEKSVFYIANKEKVYIAVVGITTFYLNMLKSRDYNIYNADGEVIGSI